ncbi:PPE family protein [Mycobacterium angelicum]|uniref:PPE family protein n=1 Tax=Mycobacterium angelicum TaxID=470074 RepID=A0A1W9ZRG9_MYCAN|nr:PPE family protein [Mycobacterium angelicum]MCV7198863.1 PPE family protein [Mycobacterium angelicum]ORA20215.1 hypothetical protein BST12_15715 [Mycobacterium angelicum]
MDFGALPPEINSGRMYAGPGSAPLLAAASAWDELASDLALAAAGYGSVISELTGSAWIGPASAVMVAAVGPYVAWLSATAAQAETASTQARAAAVAYETAFAMTLPPPAVAANRVLLMMLIATNLFGQNAGAIAAAEFHYAEMWAQDAAAMFGYAESAAMAAALTPFTPPPSIVGVVGAAATTAATGLTPTEWAVLLASLATAEGFIYDGAGYTLNIEQIAQMLIMAPSGATLATADGAARAGAGSLAPVLAHGAAIEVSATLGEAANVGRLSVPSTWLPAPASPSAPPAAAAASPAGFVRPAATGGTASLLRGLPVSGRGRSSSFGQRRQGFSPTVVHRPVVAG